MNLAEVLYEYGEFREMTSCLSSGISPINTITGSASQKAHLVFSTCEKLNCSGLVIAASDIEAQQMWLDLSFFAGDRVLYFPSKEYVFYNIDTVSREMSEKRLAVISALVNGGKEYIVVSSIDALLQYTADAKSYRNNIIEFTLGERVDLQALVEKLIIMGYVREDIVEGIGQFSVRGGIVDIYPTDMEEAIRIEFFDDETDSIRTFDASTQLSTGKLKKVTITPCREMLYSMGEKRRVVEELEAEVKRMRNKKDDVAARIEHICADIEHFNQQHYFASSDKYVNMIYGRIPTLIDYMPGGSVVFIDEPKRISERAKSFEWDLGETVSTLMEKGIIAQKNTVFAADYHNMISNISGRLMGMSTLSASCPDYRAKQSFSFAVKSLNSFHGKIEFLFDDLKNWQDKRATVVVLAGGKTRAENLVASLNNQDIECVYSRELGDISKGKIVVTTGSLSHGFEYPLMNFVLVSDREIFAPKKRRLRGSKQDEANKLRSFTDISLGDYVVHQIHGIGRYEGINKLTVDGITKDYLKIAYHGTDNLYVPVEQLDLLYKYIGGTERAVKVSRLGGADWNKTKARVKASTEQLARYLIELYAARENTKGHQYPPDSTWQREFEDDFAYSETSDQLRSIEEVKADMEAGRPMDRLLCGDVGYGKTEVALRAAFKAVDDSKQVAYLVPTTILALQHYNTFVERMKKFPMKVEMLSRFRTVAQQKQTLARLKTGETDVVIGTHRLLQKDLEFKDLGLLIIDEEQRFGVSHKEKLKEMRKDVDVLTLTATPIPRTLHMAMVNIRDMSVISQPPENRYPVQTYVMEHNEDVIHDAIRKEIGRGGQVYYLHNRVNDIYSVAQRLQKAIPEARVGVGHGKMDTDELEDVMMSVLNDEVNVLVCTTIIETGLDIPNVNTIIIESADRMGLSQLYQLRGRVGRSNRLAYAYLTYKRDSNLSDVAQKRLTAIREFTEFGSGFKIAMRDLEIRGAGNLIGAEQHGHMDAVGYDMYCKLLKESVEEMQGVTPHQKVSTTIDLSVNAHIPENYIQSQDQRIDMYKKIAAIEDLQGSYDVADEIEDRFGEIPESVNNIISIALIKAYASDVGISEVAQKNNGIMFRFEPHMIQMNMVSAIIGENSGQMLFSAGEKPYLLYKTSLNLPKDILCNITFVLQRMKELQS